MTLSIAIADAITPEPVYGMPSNRAHPAPAVFAMTAVQRDEAAREAVALQLASSRSAGRTHAHRPLATAAPRARRRPTSARSRARRNPAHQHRDLAQRWSPPSAGYGDRPPEGARAGLGRPGAQEYLHLMKRTWASDAPFDFEAGSIGFAAPTPMYAPCRRHIH